MQKKILTLSFFLFVNLLFAAFVTFKSEVSVFPGPVFMKDVIEETDIDTPTLEKIIVAYVSSNSKLSLNKKYLLNLLKRHVGIVDTKPDDLPIVIIASKQTVESSKSDNKYNIVTKDKVNNIVLLELYKNYPSDTQFNLKWQSGSIVEHDDYVISIQISNRASPFVRITLRRSGKVVGYLTFQYEAILLRKVAVAKRKIEKEEIIGVNDVEFTAINVYSIAKIPVLPEDLPALSDKIFQKGEILDGKYLKDVPIVVKGQILKAVSNVGGVTVSTLVQSLEHGYVGNVISVKNLDSGKILRGTVQEDGTIIVLEVK